MLHWLSTYVATVCFNCFKCMLEVFYLDVIYVAVTIHICCKRMFVNVSSASNVCCRKCFMLQVLHDQTREVDANGDGPLRRSDPHVRAGSEAGLAAPTCMRRRMRTIAAGGAGPTGAAAATHMTTEAAAACRRAAGAPRMHCGGHPGKWEAKARCTCPFRWSLHPGSASPAPYPAACRGIASAVWAGSRHGRRPDASLSHDKYPLHSIL
jgi:hypothetical protein